MANDLDPTTTSTPESTPTKRLEQNDSTRTTTPSFLPTRDAQANAQEQDARDKAAAMHSLDDTVVRNMPKASTLWESEQSRRSEPTTQAKEPRMRTGVLVAVVAAIAFVAGGATARLATQVPVLFQQAPQAPESTAEMRDTQEVAQTVADQQVEEITNTGTPSYETHGNPVEEPAAPEQETWDDGADIWSSQPDDTTGDEQTTSDQGSDEPTWQWTFDDQGERSISYDQDSGRVTMDYDGYSLTFDTNELWGDTSTTPDATTDAPSATSDGYDTGYRNDYGFGTGYDTGQERRDTYGWGGEQQRPWGGNWS